MVDLAWTSLDQRISYLRLENALRSEPRQHRGTGHSHRIRPPHIIVGSSASSFVVPVAGLPQRGGHRGVPLAAPGRHARWHAGLLPVAGDTVRFQPPTHTMHL